jgi:DNA-binding CsgD family transcriptional regulator
VSTYRARLMEKLKFGTNADLVRYSAEHGLLEYVAGG